MIHYLVRRRHDYTIRRFINNWAPTLRDVVDVIPYETLFHRRQAQPGVYIFSDLERLTPLERRLAAGLFQALDQSGPNFLPLNHPGRALTRFPLLTTLAAAGINSFRAYRVVDPRRLRYPVFLRIERAHAGSLTGLLRGPGDLALALLRLARHPLPLRAGLLVVEFQDTRDAAGLFRKYSAIRIGQALIPRHALVSRDWVLRKPDIVDATTVTDEQAFVRDFPHRDQVMNVFRLARIDYGRIDYSVHRDRIAVWEINTNPEIVPEPSNLHPDRLVSQSQSAARILDAFQSLDRQAKGGAPIPIFDHDGAVRIWIARIAGRLLG